MNVPDDNRAIFDPEIQGTIERIRTSAVPKESANRAIEHVLAITSNRNPTYQQFRPSRRAVLVIAGALATAAACGFFAFLITPRESFADVVDALSRESWVHVTTTDQRGHSKPIETEVWFSQSKRIFAKRNAANIELHDRIRNIYLLYSRANGQLFKLTADDGRTPGSFESAVFDAMRLLLSSDEINGDPISILTRVDDDLRDMTLVRQSSRAEQAGDSNDSTSDQSNDGSSTSSGLLVVHHIEAKHPRLDGSMTIVFRVDSDSRLPHSLEATGKENGVVFQSSATFRYPDSGPDDIYALGVPDDTPLIDETPNEGAIAIANGIQAASHRFEDHRTISVVRVDREGGSWWDGNPVIFYRKGELYRMDVLVQAAPDNANRTKPLEETDASRWWTQRVSQMEFAPRMIVRGDKVYWFQQTVPQGSDDRLRVSLKSVNDHIPHFRSSYFLVPYYGWTPEFVCRPPLGIPDVTRAAEVELSPLENAPNAIRMRLEANPLSQRSGASDKHGSIRGDVWVDPSRGHLLVKHGSTLIEEFGKTTNGHWYPRAVRSVGAAKFPDGRVFDSIRSFYVDCETELLDELFDPDNPLVP